jgi:hypothetical protein
MAGMTYGRLVPRTAEGIAGLDWLTGRDVAKFGVMVGFFGSTYSPAAW